MGDPLTMIHPNYGGSAAARSALDTAANCGRTVLSLLDEAESPGLTDEQEAALIKKGVANGLGVLMHLTAALVYAIDEAGQKVADSRG
jgi:hypothetical protein